MRNPSRKQTLGQYARAGFQDLSWARDQVSSLSNMVDVAVEDLLDAFARAADPDMALHRISTLATDNPQVLRALSEKEWRRLALLIGASSELGHFFARHPDRLHNVLIGGGRLISEREARGEFLAAVSAELVSPEGVWIASDGGEHVWNSLRIRYRELLAELMLHDLRRGIAGEAPLAFDTVSASLSDLASAALEAALAVARATVIAGNPGSSVTHDHVTQTRLAVIAMGKCGARELNVVSDVDVTFVVEPASTNDTRDAAETDTRIDTETAIRTGTKLATELMKVLHAPAVEPPLWQVDANLRPEGRQGALVRTLSSMQSYYERWAKTWEFQALLKARAVAGDLELGSEFVSRTRPLVWASSGRDDFVGSVQRMRERVTEHITSDELDVQLKLGPGGLRDIEFSVQLLQLVHGQYDERLHVAGTLPALVALVEGGYVARSDGEQLARHYRWLRVLEHRLQLRDLRRTALMPRDEEGLRVLARASQLAVSGDDLEQKWQAIKREVRELHLKIFYAPLLSAVAALPGEELVLGSDEARARLISIGFRDPDGAMRHLAALTRGSSRTARIQRNLLPVLLQWLAEGTDPDFGLLAFRRVSEANRETPWYLRLLRDGSDAAERLTRVLSTSRFAADLLESVPEAVAWLERDDLLRPIPLESLLVEMRAIASRKEGLESIGEAMRTLHRREILRLALGRLVFVNDEAAVSEGLDAAHTALLDGLLMAIRKADGVSSTTFELALIGMGRYGGRELGFASDIDLLAVFRTPAELTADQSAAALKAAERVISELRRLVDDPRFAVDLDFDLRPEGKNGPLVRSLDAYRAYYERWSLTWETQALLRARPVAGDVGLGEDFIALADRIRYPEEFGEAEVREVRRIKARVEAERLPRGADPRRHLKLGPGGISDVEWLVQLLQLQYGAHHAGLRTQSTLAGLAGAEAAGVLDPVSHGQLKASWLLASRIRSAVKLWSDRASDALPVERSELEGIAGVLGMAPGRTTELEELWFAAARRARAVFEHEFFGYSNHPETFPLILP